jgi:hypothetical protein
MARSRLHEFGRNLQDGRDRHPRLGRHRAGVGVRQHEHRRRRLRCWRHPAAHGARVLSARRRLRRSPHRRLLRACCRSSRRFPTSSSAPLALALRAVLGLLARKAAATAVLVIAAQIDAACRRTAVRLAGVAVALAPLAEPIAASGTATAAVGRIATDIGARARAIHEPTRAHALTVDAARTRLARDRPARIAAAGAAAVGRGCAAHTRPPAGARPAGTARTRRRADATSAAGGLPIHDRLTATTRERRGREQPPPKSSRHATVLLSGALKEHSRKMISPEGGETFNGSATDACRARFRVREAWLLAGTPQLAPDPRSCRRSSRTVSCSPHSGSSSSATTSPEWASTFTSFTIARLSAVGLMTKE